MDKDFSISAILDQKSSKFLKLLWIIVTCASLWGLGYYVSENYIKLNINPEVLINSRYINSRTVPFPAVTICTPLPIQVRFLNISNYFHKDSVKDDYFTKEYKCKTLSAASHICNKFQEILTFVCNAIKDVDIAQALSTVAPNLDNIFIQCIISDNIECKNIFIRSLTFRGYCFTFNMLGYHSIFSDNVSADFDAYKRKNMTKEFFRFDGSTPEYHDDENEATIPENWDIYNGYSTDGDWDQPLRASGSQSLKVRLKIKNDEFENLCPDNLRSFQVILHLPNEIPSLFSITSTVDLHTFKNMKISAEIHKIDESLMKFPLEKRKCYNENERQLKFFKSYTKLNCELECMANYSLESCGCVGFHMPRDDGTNVCDFKNISCINYTYFQWSSSYYENEEDNRHKFPDFPCNCLPTCSRIKYILVNEYSNKLEKHEKSKYSHSSLHITFGDSQILETTNYVTYKIQNFVSDIGGLVGLFLGFSLLSLFELILKIVAVFGGIIKKSKCLKADKSTSTQRHFRKSRKQKTKRARIRRIQDKSSSDVVVIDMLFGEQIKF